MTSDFVGCDTLHPRDVVIVNHGLHNLDKIGKNLSTFKDKIVPLLVSLKEKGVVVIWRETTAAHFKLNAAQSEKKQGRLEKWPSMNNGYWHKSIALQQRRKMLTCAHHTEIDASAAWEMGSNEILNEYFEGNGKGFAVLHYHISIFYPN